MKLEKEINKIPKEFIISLETPSNEWVAAIKRRKSLTEKEQVIKDVMNNIFYLDLENQVVKFYSEGVDNDTIAIIHSLLDEENLNMLAKRLLMDRTIIIETRKYVFDWNIEFLKENQEKIIEEVKKIIYQIVKDIIDASFVVNVKEEVKPNFYKRIVSFFKKLFQKPATQEEIKRYNFELVYNTKETIIGDFNALSEKYHDAVLNMLYVGKSATISSTADNSDE